VKLVVTVLLAVWTMTRRIRTQTLLFPVMIAANMLSVLDLLFLRIVVQGIFALMEGVIGIQNVKGMVIAILVIPAEV